MSYIPLPPQNKHAHVGQWVWATEVGETRELNTIGKIIRIDWDKPAPLYIWWKDEDEFSHHFREEVMTEPYYPDIVPSWEP